MARIIPAFTVRCQTNETGPTADKIRLLFRYCVQTKNHSTALKAPLPVNPPVCNQADSGGGRTRTSGVSLSQIYSLLPSPLGHATGASLLSSVTVRCVPCPIHLSPQTVSLHKLMGDGSGSWSCRESNSGLACCQPLLAVTCVGVYPHLRGGRSSVDGCVRRTRTACRRCSCTGRANPSSDCPTSPIQSFPALTR